MRRSFLLRIKDAAQLSILFRNAIFLLIMGLVFYSCNQDNVNPVSPATSKIARINVTPLGEILTLGQFDEVSVTVRAIDTGYIARARCSGFIPSGEYAGHRFKVTIEGEYSGLGPGTLVSGSAEVKIRSERFESVTSIELASFCCGEGYINDLGTHYEFVVFGQVEHSTAPIPHNHLFAGLGSTLGFMNFNVADQTGTITEPEPGGPPPHDPGIGLIIDIPAHPVTIEEVP